MTASYLLSQETKQPQTVSITVGIRFLVKSCLWSAPNTSAVTNAKPDYSVQATLCQQAWNLPVCWLGNYGGHQSFFFFFLSPAWKLLFQFTDKYFDTNHCKSYLLVLWLKWSLSWRLLLALNDLSLSCIFFFQDGCFWTNWPFLKVEWFMFC